MIKYILQRIRTTNQMKWTEGRPPKMEKTIKYEDMGKYSNKKEAMENLEKNVKRSGEPHRIKMERDYGVE